MHIIQFPIQYITLLLFSPEGSVSSAYESKEYFQEVREIEEEGKYLWFNLYTDYNIIDISGF